MAARLTKSEWIAEKNDEKKALEVKLDSFLNEALTSTDGMDALMAHYKISGLYGYSLFNSIMIHFQGGTIAQSYAKWEKLGRKVIKGEHGNIKVYVPMFKKERNVVTGKDEQVLIGFKLGPVFDIKQTDGKALEYDHNSQDDAEVDYTSIKDVITALVGVPVVEAYTGTARGFTDGKTLTISSMSNDVDKAKTLFHETAHHLMHTGKDAEKINLSPATKEVEAEAVSHLVCSYLGYEYDLSVAYVANWKAGIGTIRTKKVIATADKIIKALKG